MSVLTLPVPARTVAGPAFSVGARKLASPGRAVDRPTLAHQLAIVPLSVRTLALVTGNAPGELPADAVLVRWVAARLSALSARLASGETAVDVYRREAAGLSALGPDPAPAGEEILVGLAAAARRLAAGRLVSVPAVAAFQAALPAVAAAGLDAATPRTLDDAALGAFPEQVATLVEILGDPDAEDGALKDATRRLTVGGSRPGADVLAGIIALLRDVALGPI